MRKNLIAKRLTINHTQKQMASRLEISERQYARIEAGTSDGSLPLWQQLAKMLDSTIDYLIQREEPT